MIQESQPIDDYAAASRELEQMIRLSEKHPRDFKSRFRDAASVDADYAELIDGRFPRTLREVEDWQRNQVGR